MQYLSWRMRRPTCCAVALCLFFGVAGAAESDAPAEMRGLQEVRHLSQLPSELAEGVSRQTCAKDGIADLEQEPGSAVPKSFDRWFLLGGLSKNYALLAMQGRSIYRPSEGIHANAFSLVGPDWVASGEWILSSRPHTLEELVQLSRSPESQTLTARWRKLQRDRDLQRRIAESEPARYRGSPQPFERSTSMMKRCARSKRSCPAGVGRSLSGLCRGP
jgi:hypothetical protein